MGKRERQGAGPPRAAGAEDMEHRVWTFRAGHSVDAIVMREISGPDEIEAGRRARSTRALDEEEAQRQLVVEQVKASIVAVRRSPGGPWERVSLPLDEFEGWKTKTRNLVTEAFRAMNWVDEKELKDFQAGSTEVATVTPSGQSEDEIIEEG